MLTMRRVAWRWQWRVGRPRVEIRSAALRVGLHALLAEHVRNGRQAVCRLLGGHVVDMRRTRHVGWLVRKVSGERLGVSSGESLAERSRLDDALVGELLGRRGDYAEASRGLVATGGDARRLVSEMGRRVLVLAVACAVLAGRLLLQSGFDDTALLFPHIVAAVHIVPHDRIMGDKAWGQARKRALLDAEAFPATQSWASRGCTGASDRSLRQVESSGPVPGWGCGLAVAGCCGGHLRRPRFLLNDDLGVRGAALVILAESVITAVSSASRNLASEGRTKRARAMTAGSGVLPRVTYELGDDLGAALAARRDEGLPLLERKELLRAFVVTGVR